jgi:hypothetical protein
MSTIVKTRSFFIRIANRTNSSHAGNQGAVKNPDPERQALVHSKGVVLTNRYRMEYWNGGLRLGEINGMLGIKNG